MKFLENEKPYFEVKFDNISIFHRDNENCGIYKQFKLM